MNPTDPEWCHAALVTIDVQRDTLEGQPLEVPGTSEALPAMAKLCEAFRQNGRPIVHIMRLYLADGSNAERSRRELVQGEVPLFRPETAGRALAPKLLADDAPELDDELLLGGRIQQLGPNEVVIFKPRWGAFYDTPLQVHLESLGVSTLVFAGCNFPNCPRTSIYEASERDYRVVLIEDATSGLYERARDEMRNIGVALLNADDAVAKMSEAISEAIE